MAIKLNAQINKVNLDISKNNFLINPESRWDVFLLGNMLCEKNESDSLVKWMNKMIRFGKQVLIGDPGRDFVKLFKGLNKLAEYSLPKHTLEMHAEFKKVKVFKMRPKKMVTTKNPKYLAISPKFVMQTNAEEPLFKFKLPKDVRNEVAKLERDERLKHKNRRTYRPRNKLNNRNRKKKKSILFEWPPPLY
uniref:Uncharacterized protein n=2 Tax=Clastoptera arizonana TaxID=38151 RepID=A0A1B6D975_9HEMI